MQYESSEAKIFTRILWDNFYINRKSNENTKQRKIIILY
jgi:hypothetical protein